MVIAAPDPFFRPAKDARVEGRRTRSLLSSRAWERNPGLLMLTSTYCWQGDRASTASALLRPSLQGMKAVEASFAGLVPARAGLGGQACCRAATIAFQLVPSCAYFCT